MYDIKTILFIDNKFNYYSWSHRRLFDGISGHENDVR